MATHSPARDDRCPGALRLHEAADGLLARVRLPGGLLTAAQVVALADAADALGDGRLSLTARGNIEIRGLATDAAPRLQHVLTDAGLLPSIEHERVRNIVATPAAGLDGHGHSGDLTSTVRALDRLLVSQTRTADLSGRFLFGLDDGRGDVLALDPDVAARWVSPHHAELVLGGTPALLVATSEVPKALVGAAIAFLDARDAAGEHTWRLADTTARARITATIVDRLFSAFPEAQPVTESTSTGDTITDPPPPGRLGDHAAHVLLPLGEAPSPTWRALAAAADDGMVRTTPWRSVILAGLTDPEGVIERAQALGLITDPADPAALVSACTGLPGCASSAADVRGDVRAALAQVSAPGDLPVHASGCDRRCGHPRRPHREAVALGEVYATAEVSGAPAAGSPTGPGRDRLAHLIGRTST
ncbi:MAG: hypothetical protein Q4G43_00870 [Mobilicoccus sp.]|nr:hypothetical protein [Mobilicoccus sp.]